MHKDSFKQHKQLLTDIANAIGYTVEQRGYEDGESYIWVSLKAPDATKPSLSVDFKDGKLRFATMLPTDRWGYPQRDGYHGASIHANVSASNDVKKAAGYVKRLLASAQESHDKNLLVVEGVHGYYDKQMQNGAELVGLLEDIGAVADNLGEKPNHNGSVTLRVTLPNLYESAQVEGGGVHLTLGTLSPQLAAKVLRLVHAEK